MELLSINANCAVQNRGFVLLEIVIVLKNSALILMRAQVPELVLNEGQGF